MPKRRLDKHEPGNDLTVEQIPRNCATIISSVQLFENVAQNIYGLRDDTAIYETILREFGRSERFECVLYLPEKENGYLKRAGSTVVDARNTDSEASTDSGCIDLKGSPIFLEAVADNRCIRTTAAELVRETSFTDDCDPMVVITAKPNNDNWDAVVTPFSTTDTRTEVIVIALLAA